MNSKTLTKAVAMGLSLTMVLELTACGTIFYPERKGTKSGSIDPIVAVADAIGLLFFFIPGVVAFAVDFSNGTIYTSHGRHSSLTPDELKMIKHDGKINVEAFNRVISEKLGQAIDVQANNVQMKKFGSMDSLMAYMNSAGVTLASR